MAYVHEKTSNFFHKGVQRTYDNDGYKLRAGCLCFKDDTETEILLVSSSKDTSRWVVPSGGIDPGELPVEAAAREVYEEAGAIGKVGTCFGVFQNDKSKTKTRTYIYSMIVKNLVDPVETKDRKWFVIKDALYNLNHRPIQQSYILTAINSKLVNGSTLISFKSPLDDS